jgi:hypothetical protein
LRSEQYQSFEIGVWITLDIFGIFLVAGKMLSASLVRRTKSGRNARQPTLWFLQSSDPLTSRQETEIN